MKRIMKRNWLYFKLTTRNVKRSYADYLLYIVTVSILLAVMEAAECVAMAGKNLAGFQTASLPALIVMILIILTSVIQDFMMRQRAKEFAGYLLLGMGKKELTAVLLGEFWMMGSGCFIAGAAVGLAAFKFILSFFDFETNMSAGRSVFHSFCFFLLAEGICSLIIRRRIRKMQIVDLIREKKRNRGFQNMGDCRRWGMVFLGSFVCFFGGVAGIAFLPGETAFPLISVIAVPLIGSVFSGYRFFFGFLCRERGKRTGFFYRKDRLFPMSWVLSNAETDAVVSAVFCICILFSAVSFLFGILQFQPWMPLYEPAEREWMGFLQICLCIIFFVIYFSVSSLLILMEIRRGSGNLKILYEMGKSREQIRSILRRQAAFRLAMPMGMAALLLCICLPLISFKLHVLLPGSGIVLLKSAGVFLLCTGVFYLLYFSVVCRMGNRGIGQNGC